MKKSYLLICLSSGLFISSFFFINTTAVYAAKCNCNGAISECNDPDPEIGCAPDKTPPLPKGPLLLTSVKPEQLNADYWIKRLAEPDSILKTSAALKRFNQEIHSMIKDDVDIFQMESTKRGSVIRDQIELEYNAVKGRLLFGVDDQKIPQSLFVNTVKPLIQTEKIPEKIKVKWGVATRPTSVRSLPTNIVMLEELGDIEFDQLQYTLIKLWSPVAIYHQSSDGKWLYVQAPYIRGWVKARDIALFSTRDELKRYAKAPFLAVTGESIPVFRDPNLTEINQDASMGTLLPLTADAIEHSNSNNSRSYKIWLPRRGADGFAMMGKAYVDIRSDISEGFLPFTQRNIITQAFKLLGARYGWGGTYNGRDCSGFTQDVFLPFGIDMPRASGQQGYIGTQLSQFDPYEHANAKTKFLHEATPGVTLLRMPHHMMIYIGEVNGQFYAIHCTWAERFSKDSDDKNRINQVVVSDLTLNGRSYLGGLFERIISMNELE